MMWWRRMLPSRLRATLTGLLLLAFAALVLLVDVMRAKRQLPTREEVLADVIRHLEHGELPFPSLKAATGAGDRTLAEVLASLERQAVIVARFRRGTFPRRRFYRLLSRQRRRLR